MVSGKYIAVFFFLLATPLGGAAIMRFAGGNHSAPSVARMKVNDVQGTYIMGAAAIVLYVIGIYLWRTDED